MLSNFNGFKQANKQRQIADFHKTKNFNSLNRTQPHPTWREMIIRKLIFVYEIKFNGGGVKRRNFNSVNSPQRVKKE
jgi:hypothetical protein